MNDRFPEVPAESIEDSSWRLCFAWPARRPEHIGILESRGIVSAFRHKLRRASSFGRRHLTLGDNLGVEPIMTKRSSIDFPDACVL